MSRRRARGSASRSRAWATRMGWSTPQAGSIFLRARPDRCRSEHPRTLPQLRAGAGRRVLLSPPCRPPGGVLSGTEIDEQPQTGEASIPVEDDVVTRRRAQRSSVFLDGTGLRVSIAQADLDAPALIPFPLADDHGVEPDSVSLPVVRGGPIPLDERLAIAGRDIVAAAETRTDPERAPPEGQVGKSRGVRPAGHIGLGSIGCEIAGEDRLFENLFPS